MYKISKDIFVLLFSFFPPLLGILQSVRKVFACNNSGDSAAPQKHSGHSLFYLFIFIYLFFTLLLYPCACYWLIFIRPGLYIFFIYSTSRYMSRYSTSFISIRSHMKLFGYFLSSEIFLSLRFCFIFEKYPLHIFLKIVIKALLLPQGRV